MFAWYLLILVLNVSAIAAVLMANRRPNRRRSLGRFAVALVTLVFASGPVGLVHALLVPHGDVGGEPVDVSQKARILAETISEVMNCSAFGILAFGVPAITAFVLFLRSRSDRANGAA